MKTSIRILTATILLMIVFSCSNKSNDITPSNSSQNLKQGTWKVTYFEERGKIETSKFDGYSMTFNNDGLFNLYNSSNSFNGTWSIMNNSDDSSNSSNKLVIWISGNDVADQLQDDWIIIEQTENQITLQDDSSNHIETLRLNKI